MMKNFDTIIQKMRSDLSRIEESMSSQKAILVSLMQNTADISENFN